MLFSPTAASESLYLQFLAHRRRPSYTCLLIYLTFVPFHLSSLRNSTVAESYKQQNKTVGNKTVLEEGYYYLNNFNHILSSFGEDSFFFKIFLKATFYNFPLSSVHNLILYESNSLKHILLSSAVTLFELTVVNNWYITMVRSKHLRWLDCSLYWR